MVLQYYREDISAEKFAVNWLPCDGAFYSDGNCTYGPDPNENFIGSPFDGGSYGCFAPVIAQAICKNSPLCRAEVLTGQTLDELCQTYVGRGKPLLIWATTNMAPSQRLDSWYLPDGSLFYFPLNEHCLVLIGYDEDEYFFNEPLTGGTAAYPRELVETRFAELGQQAVYISRR